MRLGIDLVSIFNGLPKKHLESRVKSCVTRGSFDSILFNPLVPHP